MVCGGVIPPQDYQFLYDAGVADVFGPGKWRTSSTVQKLILHQNPQKTELRGASKPKG